jgi:hypothetical protein
MAILASKGMLTKRKRKQIIFPQVHRPRTKRLAVEEFPISMAAGR